MLKIGGEGVLGGCALVGILTQLGEEIFVLEIVCWISFFQSRKEGII